MTGTDCDLFTHKSSRSYLNHLILNLNKIRPVGAELLHADRQTVMTKLIVAFDNFPNAPNKQSNHLFHFTSLFPIIQYRLTVELCAVTASSGTSLMF
jgi:hypothetical protein